MDSIYNSLTDPNFFFAALVGVAVFATIFTVMMPMLGGTSLEARMKNVAIERDNIRARERARLADLAHELARDGVGAQAPDRARGANPLEQGHVFADPRDVDCVAQPGRSFSTASCSR